MNNLKQNIVILACCQAVLFLISSTVVSVSSLAGHALSANKLLSSLPITTWMLGAALITFPASLYMNRSGRRAGFLLGTIFGIIGAAVAGAAIYAGSFRLLCLGTLVLGCGNGIGQYYRFAAADASPAAFRSTAISLVLTGGLAGGLLGPMISRFTVDVLPQRFLGCYLALGAYLLLAILLLGRLRMPAPSEAERSATGRPLAQVARQPAFLVAVTSAALANGVMVLLMVSTPLAMSFCHHSYGAATSVIGWHFIGMLAPSLITGRLIQRFGTLKVMLAGTVILYLCVAIALSGSGVEHFWFALFLLGIGWNFIYIGGTTMLSDSCRPAEKARAQGLNDLAIAVVQVVTSISSGVLVNSGGWAALNHIALLTISVIASGLLWQMWKGRTVTELAGLDDVAA